MEKRVFGIVLTVLGIIGLVAAAINFINKNASSNAKTIVVYGLLGIIFFSTGIGLLKTTNDRPQ